MTVGNGVLGTRRKGLIFSLLLSFISLGLLIHFTWEEETLTSLALLNPRGVLLSFLLVICLWLVEGLRIKSILKALGSRVSISLFSSAQIFLITFFCGGVTPWAIGEWPAHILALTRKKVTPGEAVAAALLRSFFTKVLFLILAGIILFFFEKIGVGVSVGIIFRGAFTIVALTSLVYILIMFKPGVVLLVLDLLRKFPLTNKLYKGNKGVARFLRNLLAEARRFRGSLKGAMRRGPFFLIIPFFLTILYWIMYFSIAPLILWGFGLNPPYLTAISWQVMIVIIINYMPLPGGSGVAEIGAASLFAGFVPGPLLGVFIAAWRFFTYYVSLLFGGITFFTFFRR